MNMEPSHKHVTMRPICEGIIYGVLRFQYMCLSNYAVVTELGCPEIVFASPSLITLLLFSHPCLEFRAASLRDDWLQQLRR
jgi:hypothetical protein